MTDEKAAAGAGTAAGPGRTWLWAGGAAAGLAAGAAVWALVLREPPVPVAQTPAPAASATAPASTPAGAAPAAAPAAEPAATVTAPAEPATPAAPSAEPAAPPSAVATATPVPAEPQVAAPPAATTPQAAEVQPAATAPPASAPPEAAPAAPAPAFDTVRAEADGSVLIAGRAVPGAEVAVLADGAEVTRATADDRGQFVAFAQLAPSTSARVLTLRTGEAASDQSVILAPVAPPAQVAAVAPGASGAVATAPASPAAPSPAAAPAAPEVLIADSSGVHKMAPAPTDGVVIDTISYAANGDVMLAGRAPGLVRLYLDDGLVAEARPVEGTWEARLADVAPGLYRLRADAIGPDGKVTSRFETPFQREAPETLAAAMAPAAPAPSGDTLPMPVLPSAPPAMTTAEAPPITLPALPQGPAPVVTEATVVTVQPGFTLWRIARENYGDGLLYVKVFQANKDQIRNPDLIYPGQVFTVPDK